MSEPVTFLASFPPIQSAIKITGAGDGARIQLDIPETELPAIARLLLLREQVLMVTIEPVLKNRKEHDNAQAVMGEGTKRKSCWKATEKQGIDGPA